MRITPFLPIAALLTFAPAAHANPLVDPFSPKLPEVIVFNDGSLVVEVQLFADCISIPFSTGGSWNCTDTLPGGGKIYMRVGSIPRPPETAEPFIFGETFFEAPGDIEGGTSETPFTLSGDLAVFDGPTLLFNLPFIFTFGSVTFETTFSTVFSDGGRQWIARTAGIGTAGNSTIEDAPDPNGGPFDLFMRYLPFDVRPVAPVPEPASAALILLGLAGLGAVRRRR